MRPIIRHAETPRRSFRLEDVRLLVQPRNLANALRHPIWRAPPPKPQLRDDVRAHDYMPIRLAWRLGGPRALARVFARIIATSFWMEAYPCCLGYRYGHGWTRYVTVPQDAPVPKHGVLVGHRRIDLASGPDAERRRIELARSAGLHDDGPFEAIIAMGPAPCPTCGKQPPRKLVAAWQRAAKTT